MSLQTFIQNIFLNKKTFFSRLLSSGNKWKMLATFFVFYLIRDLVIYVLIPSVVFSKAAGWMTLLFN